MTLLAPEPLVHAERDSMSSQVNSGENPPASTNPSQRVVTPDGAL